MDEVGAVDSFAWVSEAVISCASLVWPGDDLSYVSTSLEYAGYVGAW